MATLLGLLAALGYGMSDFVGGVASRRGDPTAVALVAQPFGLLAAVVAVLVLPDDGPDAASLAWGALSGVGSGVGSVALYRGLAVGSMSTVAPLSGVLTAALPVVAGVAFGEHLAALTLAGIVLAGPAIALVSLQRPPGAHPGHGMSAVLLGLTAGGGFALLFIGLDRAGDSSGAWPLVPGQGVAVLLIALALARSRGRPGADAARLGVVAGALGGTANLLFLASTRVGDLAVVSVLTGLYPAVTVLMARVLLTERWSRLQATGLVMAVVAVILISTG